MRCQACDKVIHDGDSGWYDQVPVVTEFPATDGYPAERMTFMDRNTVCSEGSPHVPTVLTEEPVPNPTTPIDATVESRLDGQLRAEGWEPCPFEAGCITWIKPEDTVGLETHQREWHSR